MAIERIRHESPDDVHLAMGEIQDVHEGENQGQPKRDHRILRAQIDTVYDDLFHEGILLSRRTGPDYRTGARFTKRLFG